jgi:hypothetical protein
MDKDWCTVLWSLFGFTFQTSDEMPLNSPLTRQTVNSEGKMDDSYIVA